MATNIYMNWPAQKMQFLFVIFGEKKGKEENPQKGDEEQNHPKYLLYIDYYYYYL